MKPEEYVCRRWWWLKEKCFALHNAYVLPMLGMTHLSAALLYKDAEASTEFGPELISYLQPSFANICEYCKRCREYSD